jgi:hypothetical protein
MIASSAARLPIYNYKGNSFAADVKAYLEHMKALIKLEDRLLRVIGLWLAFCASAPAQQSQAYVAAAPGGISIGGGTAKALYGAIGAEGIVGSGIGLGAEVGAIRQASAQWHGVLAYVSTNVYYHFVRSGDRTDPFVTAGYTSQFRGAHHEAGQDRGQANMVNFGGGVNYWFRPGLGAKIEFRDNLRPKRGVNPNYWSFRVGILIRFGNR